MAYEESAKSQMWISKDFNKLDGKGLVTSTNVGTSLCLAEPMENEGKRGKAKTILKACPTNYIHLDFLYYFEKIGLMSRKRCTPF